MKQEADFTVLIKDEQLNKSASLFKNAWRVCVYIT